MTQAPSIKEALEELSQIDGSHENVANAEVLAARVRAVAKAALATFQPDGERREAIARIIDPHAFIIVNPKRVDMMDRQRLAREKADSILASGLVQDEAGWRDISTAPKDGTPIILSGTFRTGEGSWGVCRPPPGGHRANEGEPTWRTADKVYRFPGTITHWMPMPIRSACDGGAET